MIAAFKKLPKVVQVILLLIPGINWIVEIILRWGRLFEKFDVVNLLIAILTLIGGGVILGWIDCVLVALSDRLLLE